MDRKKKGGGTDSDKVCRAWALKIASGTSLCKKRQLSAMRPGDLAGRERP